MPSANKLHPFLAKNYQKKCFPSFLLTFFLTIDCLLTEMGKKRIKRFPRIKNPRTEEKNWSRTKNTGAAYRKGVEKTELQKAATKKKVEQRDGEYHFDLNGVYIKAVVGELRSNVEKMGRKKFLKKKKRSRKKGSIGA